MLEACIDVVCLLMRRNPLKFNELLVELDVNAVRLSKCLDFLVDCHIVQVGGRGSLDASYMVTVRGVRLLRFFKVDPLVVGGQSRRR